MNTKISNIWQNSKNLLHKSVVLVKKLLASIVGTMKILFTTKSLIAPLSILLMMFALLICLLIKLLNSASCSTSAPNVDSVVVASPHQQIYSPNFCDTLLFENYAVSLTPEAGLIPYELCHVFHFSLYDDSYIYVGECSIAYENNGYSLDVLLSAKSPNSHSVTLTTFAECVDYLKENYAYIYFEGYFAIPVKVLF